VDSYEGTAALEWWANGSTCLGRFRVSVAVRVSEGSWTCEAVFEPPLSVEDRETFDSLTQLDPHFLLRFDDGAAALPVDVVQQRPENPLVLIPAEGDDAVRTSPPTSATRDL
jgi:hypothetical protein